MKQKKGNEMAEVVFKEVIQNIHEYNRDNTDDNIMISKIKLEYNGDDYTVEIKQPFGVNFEYTEGIELIIPPDAKRLKKLNYNELSDKCEEYYRSLIGSGGHGIHIEGTSNVHMSNNRFVNEQRVNISLAPVNGTAW